MLFRTNIQHTERNVTWSRDVTTIFSNLTSCAVSPFGAGSPLNESNEEMRVKQSVYIFIVLFRLHIYRERESGREREHANCRNKNMCQATVTRSTRKRHFTRSETATKQHQVISHRSLQFISRQVVWFPSNI